MESKALIATEAQTFSLEKFPVPDLGPSQILVESLYSGVSVGTEFAVIQGKLDWGPFPVCTGYQGVGLVQAVGDEVTKFKVDEQSLLPAQFYALKFGFSQD